MKNEDLIVICTDQLQQGKTISQVIRWLSQQQVSPVDAIKSIRIAAQIPLREAKQLVMEDPAWEREASSAELLHDQLEAAAIASGGKLGR